MDPNTALSNARTAAADIITVADGDDCDTMPAVAVALAEAFAALDGWLTHQGFLPTAWER